jgi:hypothetical protein
VYNCEVTNKGRVGITIRRVTLEPPEGGNVSIVLSLLPGEEQRILEQGDSQSWEVDIDSVNLMKPEDEQRQRGQKVIAVVEDTGDKKYKSKPSKTVDYPISDL